MAFEVVEQPNLFSSESAGRKWSLILPWAPSVNNYWNHTRTGQTFTTRRAKQFKTDCLAIVLSEHGRLEPTGERLRVSIVLRCKDRKRYDVDNFSKPILDALKHCRVYKDDWLVDDLRVLRGKTFPGGRIEVYIEEI